MPITDHKKEEWDRSWGKSDRYTRGIMKIAKSAFDILDEESGPITTAKGLLDRAERKSGIKGATGFMWGAAAEVIVHFHTRGREFRKKWNAEYGIEEPEMSEEEEKVQAALGTHNLGVVNPAVIHIGHKANK